MFSFIMCCMILGGFYDWCVSVVGICVVFEILHFYKSGQKIYKNEKNIILWIPTGLLIWMCIVSLWSVDYVENMGGVLRGVVLLCWMYLCFQMEDNQKQKILGTVPYIGAIMTIVGVISLLFPAISRHFWQARRLGGFFQYSNTCALFLAVGIILALKQDNVKKVVRVSVILILLLGIFLTGSRSVLLLLFLYGIYKAVTVKHFRMPFVWVTVICLLVAGGYGLFTKDMQNISRIFTLFQANSTIWGRLLYYIDALSIIKKYPFGLGYGGYYYIHPMMQTGVYTTRFVHNDFLQIAIDYGLIAFIVFVIYMGYQIIKGKQDTCKKEILFFVLAASLVDFHMQYLGICMLLVLCLDLGEKQGIKKKKEIRENYFFCGTAIVVFVYLTIALGAFYCGNSELSLALIPRYTSAQIQKLEMCSDKSDAVTLATEIINHNKYVSDAYHSLIYAAAMDGDYESVIGNMDKALAIRRYDIELYRMYEELLENMITAYDSMGNENVMTILKEYKEELPKRLAILEKETHPIAYKLRDKPTFSW